MIDTIIVSGGNIHSDFALDFLKKNEACLIAADKGLEFFLEHQLLPDAVIGDFDSLSEDGKKFLEIHEERSMDSEIPYGGMTEWKLQKGFGNEKKEIKVIHLLPRQAMYTLKPVRKEEKKRRAIRLARRLFLIYADMK